MSKCLHRLINSIDVDVEGMTESQLSAIAQQVVDMQDREDAGPSSFNNGPIASSEIDNNDPITPTRIDRPVRIRQSTSKVRDNLETVKSKSPVHIKTPIGNGGSGKKRKSETPNKPKPKTQTSSQRVKRPRQRAFNGKVSMTARPLCRSDGRKRGDGVWPEKGSNTVKGNMVCRVFLSL